MNKNSLIFSTIAVISMALFWLSDKYQIFGRAYNYFFPCVQNDFSSFPCYATVDVSTMGILLAVILFSVVLLVLNILKGERK